MKRPARKTPPAPTAEAFRAHAHVMLDTLLTDRPGTDAIMIIVDGLSGHEVASIPLSIAVKKGMFLVGYEKLFPGETEA